MKKYLHSILFICLFHFLPVVMYAHADITEELKGIVNYFMEQTDVKITKSYLLQTGLKKQEHKITCWKSGNAMYISDSLNEIYVSDKLLINIDNAQKIIYLLPSTPDLFVQLALGEIIDLHTESHTGTHKADNTLTYTYLLHPYAKAELYYSSDYALSGFAIWMKKEQESDAAGNMLRVTYDVLPQKNTTEQIARLHAIFDEQTMEAALANLYTNYLFVKEEYNE